MEYTKLRVNVNNFFKIGLTLILLLTFVLGGFFQFFLGVPTTIYFYLLLILTYMFVMVDVLLRKKIIIDKIIILNIVYIFLIFLSGIINKTSLIKILLYVVFPLTPLCIHYLLKIFDKRNLKIEKGISAFLNFIVLIQLPIILIQKYGYHYLIKFSNTNQVISGVDFMFGSFSIKADHSLGFFLIMFLLSIIFKVKAKQFKKTPWFLIVYITLTIFVMESNLTKIVLVIIFLYYASIYFYKKLKLFGSFIIVGLLYLTFNFVNTIPLIKTEILHFKQEFTAVQSHKAVERGYAKRPQILVDQLYNYPLKIIGNGPYDYFNVLTGEFKNTIHFSQLIWTYNDLGVFGAIVILLIAYYIVKYFKFNRQSFILIFFILLLYLFMTNVFSDIAMMLTLFILKKYTEDNKLVEN